MPVSLCLFRLAKAVGDDLEPLLDLRLFDGQRHQDAQHVVVRPAGEQDQAFVAGAGDDIRRQPGVRPAAVALFKQLNGDHRPQTAHVADLRMIFSDRQQALAQGVAELVGFFQQILLLENL